MRFSVAITIHDEERNIGKLLDRLAEEPLEDLGLDRVIVVSSASTDRSDEIVREHAERWQRVELIQEDERRGKASAINLALEAIGDVDVVLLMSGDVLPVPGAIGLLLRTFDDEKVGMVGGRPVPQGRPTNLIHHVVRLQWDLHHEVALHSPKLGEVVAFRKVFDSIPVTTAVDEASIEAILREQGFRFAYVPEAIIENKGPDTLGDFLKQRRRIAAGHSHLKSTQDYEVSTTRNTFVAGITLKALVRQPWRLPVFCVAAGLELVGRCLGLYDLHVKGKNPYIWDIAASTKDPAGAAASGKRTT